MQPLMSNHDESINLTLLILSVKTIYDFHDGSVINHKIFQYRCPCAYADKAIGNLSAVAL